MSEELTNQVDILLSVYNGSAYLEEQIQSILNQTYRHWRILARDDRSKDDSLRILSYYKTKYPGKIKVIAGNNLGVTQSFHELLKASDAPYAMFCDQDDVWFADKIDVMVAHIWQQEEEYGRQTPLLVFSDLALIDGNGGPIGPSFWRLHGVNPRHSSLNRLLLQNVVTGCASLFNRALINAALPICNEAILHDWWFALNATLFGKLSFIDRATVYYRQHSANQVGAKGITFDRIKEFIAEPAAFRKRSIAILQRTSAQARSLASLHQYKISGDKRYLLERYASIPEMTSMERKQFFLKEKIFFTSILRNIWLFII